MSKRHVITIRAVDRPIFESMKSGIKSIETRAATDKYSSIALDDTLSFSCEADTFERTVADIKHYASIEDVFDSPDIDKILPGVSTLEEARRIYYSFPEYEEKIARYGILAFSLV